ncbi:hypothetical protein ACKKBG_A24945 [Auxenochlorella protothecoides x Auxenochlorella symbiontica]
MNNSGLLYPRYIRPQDIVLGSSQSVPRFTPAAVAAPAHPTATPQGPPQPPISNGVAAIVPPTKTRAKPRWSSEQKEAVKASKTTPSAEPAVPGAAPAATPDGAPSAAAATPGKGQKVKRAKLAPEERVSGPGNADEASRMRSTLGYAAAPPAPAPAPVPAAPPAAGAFSFGFQPAGTPQAEAGPSSSSEEEEEQVLHISGTPAAAPAPAAAETSSSSEEESSSSSSDEEEATPVTSAAAGGAQDGEYVPRRVYVGGMPYRFTEAEIREYWGYCGEIESMDIMTFPDTGRFRGIAFITFATEEAYQAALGYDGEDCEGQRVKVQRCKAPTSVRRQAAPAIAAPTAAAPAAAIPPTQAGASPAPPAADARGSAPKTPGYHVAYVGNVAYDADEATLQKLFEPFNVTLVRLHTDKETGRPKGFAHVHFRDEASLDGALQLNGTQLMGRAIKVGYAQAKKNHNGGA